MTSRLINRRLELGRFRWRIMKFFWWITRFTIMLCTQLSRTFICRPFIGRCFVRLTTTDDKDVGRLGRSDPLERTQIYCAYSKTCNTIWLIMEQWVSNTDQQLTAYHMYPLNKRLEKIHIYPMRGYDDKSSVFSGSEFIGQRCWLAVITQGSRYGSHHARSLETSWWIGNKNCQILRRTHSELCYM